MADPQNPMNMGESIAQSAPGLNIIQLLMKLLGGGQPPPPTPMAPPMQPMPTPRDAQGRPLPVTPGLKGAMIGGQQ